MRSWTLALGPVGRKRRGRQEGPIAAIKPVKSAANSDGFSAIGKCPTPRIKANWCPAINCAVSRTRSGGVVPSFVPAIINAGRRSAAVVV